LHQVSPTEGDDMTATSAPHQSAVAARPGPRRRRYLPAAAGAADPVAWAAGLAAWPSNLALNATNAQATAAYRAHPAGAVVQYLLVEGLAGLLLAVVLGFALLPLAQRRPATPAGARPAAGLAAAGLAVAAVVISLVQCVLGLVLVAAATSADVARAGGLSALENRLDGVKMLALAGVAAYLAVTRLPVRGARPRPRWLRETTGLAALFLAGSAVAYLFLINALAWIVYLSGPFLLLWIAATGIWLTVTAGRPAATRQATRQATRAKRHPASSER
jgi:hypothetical protein